MEKKFQWVPGETASDDALVRMRSRFRKPHHPTGEAWFMGAKRKMYDELAAETLSELPCNYFQDVLFEMSTGITSFPGMAYEWEPWLRYILPELILRTHESYVSYVLEGTVTAFTAYFAQSLEKEYEGFHQDVVRTLGIALMNPGFWMEHPNGERNPLQRIPCFLVSDFESIVSKRIAPRNVEGAFSAAMFFGLRYLKPHDMASWIESILLIENSFWRAAFLNWLMGARKLLTSRTHDVLENAAPSIGWDHSFLLERVPQPLISQENALAFKEQISIQLTMKLLGEWEVQLKNEEQFAIELHGNQTAGLDLLFSQVLELVKV